MADAVIVHTPGLVFEPEGRRLGGSWGWFVLRGALALVLAGAAFVFPLGAIFAFALVFAAFCAVDGLLSLAAGIRGAARGRRWIGPLLRGIVSLAVPVLFFIAPGAVTIGYAVLTLAIVIGWALVSGMAEIVAAFELRGQVRRHWLLGLTGVVSIALGVAIMVLLWRDPLATLVSVGWLIALWALLAGIGYVAFGLELRRMAPGARQSPPS